MAAWEMNLASQHHAQEIHESLEYSIYRTSQSDESLAFLRATRADYIKGSMIKMLAVKMLSLIFFVVGYVLEQNIERHILLCMSILTALSILYTLFGLIKQIQLCKKYNAMIKK